MADEDKDGKGSEDTSSSSSSSGSTDAGTSVQGSAQSAQESEEAWKRMGQLIDERVGTAVTEGLKNWQPATGQTSQSGDRQEGRQTQNQNSGGQTKTRSQSKPVKLGIFERLGFFGDPAKLIKSRQE